MEKSRLVGVPFVNQPHGLRAAAGGDFLLHHLHEDDHADFSQRHAQLAVSLNFVKYPLCPILNINDMNSILYPACKYKMQIL
jgi:hypothetical protein